MATTTASIRQRRQRRRRREQRQLLRGYDNDSDDNSAYVPFNDDNSNINSVATPDLNGFVLPDPPAELTGVEYNQPNADQTAVDDTIHPPGVDDTTNPPGVDKMDDTHDHNNTELEECVEELEAELDGKLPN